jgi:epoxyqueuosine reductase
VNGHVSQEVCPWNQRFAKTLPEGSPFAPREFLAGKDARRLAEDLLAMSQDDFSTAFRKSPMKRAKLAVLKRNARMTLERADEV